MAKIKINPYHFYLDYVNNYLLVKDIAKDYEMTKKEAFILIEQGRAALN